ncbi:BC1881 family protein [Tissierella sp.]|uniref:BC1881 family protein n=1 Tax=Tissierella sp. TaxID=41274 RepID=UPI0028A96E95|nr:BC1881 family protein [Tissierella sp.]
MLKDISTKDLMEELSKRQGVNAYNADYGAKYKIIVRNPGFAEDTGTTTIKEDNGPAIILEVID